LKKLFLGNAGHKVLQAVEDISILILEKGDPVKTTSPKSISDTTFM
jgi:hypothetical protein